MNESNNFENRFKKQLNLSDKQCRILDSIRFQDEDKSAKLGSILAFSGLIIATSIVQLSTSENSIVHVDSNNLCLIVLNVVGLLLLFSASFICMIALISSKKYSKDTEEALVQFDDYVGAKKLRVKFATVLAISGTITILSSLIYVLIRGVVVC